MVATRAMVGERIRACGVNHCTDNIAVRRRPHSSDLLMHDAAVVNLLRAHLMSDGAGNVAMTKVTRGQPLLPVLAPGRRRHVET